MRDRILALDGLRAVACLAVVVFHLRLLGGCNGWLGVDMFFVLSGWLITGILREELKASGRIRLGTFYLRRAARLYPALILAALGAFALQITGAREGSLLLGDAIPLTYLTDVWLLVARDAPPGILGHTWSLAIEEHFYLLWPLVVIAIRGRRSLAAATAIAAIASFAAMALTPGLILNAASGYFLTQARVWELLAGCLLALWSPCVPRWFSPWLAVAGVVVLGVAAGFGSSARPIILSATCLASVAGTAAIIVAGRGGGLVAWVLSVKPMTWLGERSYGIYLYHPLVIRALGDHFKDPRSLRFSVVVALSALVAHASYELVEHPVREAVNRRLRGQRRARAHGMDSLVLTAHDAGL